MENVDLEKIKDRVAKLLRMAADSASPNEAAIAAGRARALMDKYQIEAFDANNQVKDVFCTGVGSSYFKNLPTYMSTLAVQIAKYNDCQGRYENADYGHDYGKQRIIFNGYKQDVDLAVEMFSRLLTAINRLARQYVRGLKDAPADPMRLIIQFKMGAVAEINMRLRTMTAERDAITSSGGTSLVVAKKEGVEKEFGRVKYSSSSGVVVSGAAEQEARRVGHVKGASIEITKSVR
jgi:acetylglutamate synthase